MDEQASRTNMKHSLDEDLKNGDRFVGLVFSLSATNSQWSSGRPDEHFRSAEDLLRLLDLSQFRLERFQSPLLPAPKGGTSAGGMKQINKRRKGAQRFRDLPEKAAPSSAAF
jgi:hypothetical protein